MIYKRAVFSAVELEYASQNQEYYRDSAYPPRGCDSCSETGYNQQYKSYNVTDDGKNFHK
jgi:type II secretory ATPase GspE/PulE/Tfp pilus assembly ATPase PilB-like protein